MKRKLTAMIPYLIVLAVLFYAVPLLIRDTGSAMLLMALVIPLLTLICAAVYGKRQGFHPLFALITAVLFTPTVFIFYNSSAWIYIVIYAGISLGGNGIGGAFYKPDLNL